MRRMRLRPLAATGLDAADRPGAAGSRITRLAAASLRHFAGTGAEPAVRREFAALVERASGGAPVPSGEAV
jgi:hypothetical protein